jgi:hypothetical protein
LLTVLSGQSQLGRFYRFPEHSVQFYSLSTQVAHRVKQSSHSRVSIEPK